MQTSESMKFNRNWPHQRIEIGRLKTQFQCLGANFADRWPPGRVGQVTLNKGAFAFIFVLGGGGGALKWPLKGGSRLIQVAATTGLTVQDCLEKSLKIKFALKST